MIPQERIDHAILFIRKQKVMLDRDLAILYGVPTKTLNQAVKRNKNRFPKDFMFQLTQEEIKNWLLLISSGSRSQIVTLKRGQNIKYRPYAFTEHGILMLSSVLKSERAIDVNIAIMRTFVKLRKMFASNAELARKLKALEEKYDEQFQVVFEAIRQLTNPPIPPKRQIGFRIEEPKTLYKPLRKN
ncbi:MAG: ORF6N domain-containing protein [Ignavibacteriales bacterium]|nr:ORF6N domain-containing protein [Ignavibacteriales bacterium]